MYQKQRAANMMFFVLHMSCWQPIALPQTMPQRKRARRTQRETTMAHSRADVQQSGHGLLPPLLLGNDPRRKIACSSPQPGGGQISERLEIQNTIAAKVRRNCYTGPPAGAPSRRARNDLPCAMPNANQHEKNEEAPAYPVAGKIDVCDLAREFYKSAIEQNKARIQTVVRRLG